MGTELLLRGLIGLALFAVLYTAGSLVLRKGGGIDDANDLGLD